jgi:hypothetical protein
MRTAAPLDQSGELLGVEGLQPAPEPDVRCLGHLGLEADEMLQGGGGRHRLAFKEQLAGEEGPVQRPARQHRPRARPLGSRHGRPRRRAYGTVRAGAPDRLPAGAGPASISCRVTGTSGSNQSIARNTTTSEFCSR